MHATASSRSTRRLVAAVGVAAVTAGALAVASPSLARGDDQGSGSGDVLRSGVAASLTQDGPTLFTVTPGGAPWVIDEGRVRVDQHGRLRAEVEGLVIPSTTGSGTNPLDFLGASLVCNNGIVATTTPVPFSDSGDAEISQTVPVPDNCLAPAVLFHPASATAVTTGRYIAASGSSAGR